MDDDEAYEPDQSGYLDLKYRGWTVLDVGVSSFAHCLQSLDVSFNQLVSIPDEIKSLRFLQVLNCSCNKIKSLPESIGTLEALTVLKANGNQLLQIPTSIGHCTNLQQLILSENILTSLPQEIDGCTHLQKLLVQNNDLSRIPLSLSSLEGTLLEIDLSNNNKQLATTIPPQVHRDVDSVMWIITLQREKRRVIDDLKEETKNLQHDVVRYEFDLLKLEEQISILEQKKRDIKTELDDVKYFLRAREYKRRMQSWMDEKWEEIKLACARKLPV